MKFKVTATIPIELEIDCQSKEEALDTATTILQEQRDDGDYASIVADCIESALVSGSITMTAVDNHEALVNELRTKRKISIQDMDAFLGYEIDKNDDMMFDDDYINVNLWMMDVDKALGLDVCTSDNDEYVTISAIGIRKLRSIPINAKSTSSLFTRKRMAMISTWSLKWMTLNTLLFLRISRRSSKILSGNP